VQLEWLTDDLQPHLVAAAFAVVLATLATAEPSLPCVGVAGGVGAAEGGSALGPYQPLGDACAVAGWLLASCCQAFAPPEPDLPPVAGGANGDVVASPGKNGGKRGGSLGGSLKAATSGRGCRPRSADDLSSPPSSPRSTSASAVVSTVSTSSAAVAAAHRSQRASMLPGAARALKAWAIKFLRGLGPCLEERLAHLVHWRATQLQTQTSYDGSSRASGSSRAAAAREAAASVACVRAACVRVAAVLAAARGLAHSLARKARGPPPPPLGSAAGRTGRRTGSRSDGGSAAAAVLRSLPRLALAFGSVDAALARLAEAFHFDPFRGLLGGTAAPAPAAASAPAAAAAAGSNRGKRRRSGPSTSAAGKRGSRVGGSKAGRRRRRPTGHDFSSGDDDDDSSDSSNSSDSSSGSEGEGSEAGSAGAGAATGSADRSAREWRCLVPTFLSACPASSGSSGGAAATTAANAAAAAAAVAAAVVVPGVAPPVPAAAGGGFTPAADQKGERPDGRLSAGSLAGGFGFSARTAAFQPPPAFGFERSAGEDGSEDDSDDASCSSLDRDDDSEDSEGGSGFVVMGAGGAWG
jgi:hypothetical protein